MSSVLRFVGIAFLVVATAFGFLTGVITASFRGDQIVAAYALQLGSARECPAYATTPAGASTPSCDG